LAYNQFSEKGSRFVVLMGCTGSGIEAMKLKQFGAAIIIRVSKK
jgi:hypothetical protein